MSPVTVCYFVTARFIFIYAGEKDSVDLSVFIREFEVIISV